MARLLVVLLIPVILNFQRCQSSIETLKLQNEQNSMALDQIQGDNRDTNQNSQSEMTTESANGESTLTDNSQLPLKRPSRTVKHKLSCPFHSKCKHGSKSLNHSKGQKFWLLPKFLKHSSGFLKSFMLEIEKVLNWWHVAVEKLKGKIEHKQIGGVSTKEIEMMHAQFPTIKNRIFELMAFFFEYLDLNGPHYYHDSSKRISTDIKKSFEKIKNLALSFIMSLEGLKHLNHDLYNKLVNIKAYFDSIPTDQYAILDHGLISEHEKAGINGNIDVNFGYNEEMDNLKGQTHMLRNMWEYISELPAVFAVILKIIGELSTVIDWELSSFDGSRPNYTPLSIANLNNRQKEINAQLDCTEFHTMPKIFGHDLIKTKFHPPPTPTRDWVRLNIQLEKSVVLSLLGSGSQLTIGDIVILHLTNDIILVGRVDDNVNPIIFNIIYNRVAQKQPYIHSTTIWNLSYQHLSSNSQIYNYIMSSVGCR